MIYAKTITSPFGRDVTTYTDTVIRLSNGFIYQFDLYFPSGSQGLLKVQVNEYKVQLYPFTPGEYFYGDGIQISFPESHLIQNPPYELRVRHYNEDEAYDHQFQLRIGFVAAEEFIARFLPSVAAEEMARAILKIKDTEDLARLAILEQNTLLLDNLASGTPSVVE